MSGAVQKALEALFTDPATGELIEVDNARWGGIRLALTVVLAIVIIALALGMGASQ